MNILIEYCIPLLIIIIGVFQILTGQTIGTTKKQEAKYTRESLDKAYRISGYPLALAGILLLLGSLAMNEVISIPSVSETVWFYASLACIAAYLVIILVYRKRIE